MTEDSSGPRARATAEEPRWIRQRVVMLYALFAALWILGSDKLLDALVRDRETLVMLGAYKGWFFVAITSVLLYILLQGREALRLKEAEAQHQAGQLRTLQLLQSIADNSGDAIYAKDTQGRFVLFNREACRVAGKPAEAVIGKSDYDIWPQAQADRMEASDLRVMETGQPFTYENEVDTVDGPTIYLSTKGLLRGPDGEPAGVFGISRNITERRRAEQALRDSAELMQAVEDSVLDHLAVLDPQGRIIAVNTAWQQFGSNHQEPACDLLPRCAAGLNYLETMATAGSPEAALARSGILTVLEGRQPAYTQECACSHKDGVRHWFVMKVTPLRVNRGGAVVMFSDITDLKRTAAELARLRDGLEALVDERTGQLERTNRVLVDSERFVRTMTDNMPAALAYWDRGLRCRFANRLYRAHYRLEERAILGMDLAGVIGQESCRKIAGKVKDVLDGKPCRYAVVQPGSGGGPSHHLVDFIPDNVDGKVQGFFILASEITALKVAQRQIEATNGELVVARDRAEAATRAKSAFLANMSHEIRTPMNAVIGFAELLKADCADPEAARRLEQLSEAACHLLDLINDILDLSKIESGKFTLEHADFSLGDAVNRATMMVEHSARAKGLEFLVDVGGVPDALNGDPMRLSQTLLNLLGNAVKFTEHGRIELRAAVLEETADDCLLRFEVRDTGIGIAADKLANLFCAFEQADSSTTRKFGGTGLGLALTKHIAELMGGQAGVNSESGVGSTFWFTARLGRALPTNPQAPGRQAPARRAAPDAGTVRPLPAVRTGNAHVLVVEDNRFNQEVTLAALKRAGLAADLARDGREAVEMAGARRYDLVLMDLQMPEMDGFQATRALRGMPAYESTPILALTANAFGETRAACLAAGMDDHIGKPVSPQRLAEAVHRWLAHVPAPQPAEPPAAGTQLAERLAGIEGFDPAAGLALFGDEAQFERMLWQFAASHEDGLPGLDQCLATGQRESARRMVHSLKGSAAAIGASMLRQLAEAGEAAIARGDAMERVRLLAFDLEYELVHFVSALQDRLPVQPDEAPQAQGMNPARLADALEGLGFLLVSGDFEAQRYHREIAGALRAAFGQAAEQLAAAVRGHDHERALLLLDAMKAGGRAPAKGSVS